ncbi:MAG: hypothetical protein HQ522_05680 [Bacteroidetes bacterium]|nr:hypothetical protein [Bacteroidota bacterium]
MHLQILIENTANHAPHNEEKIKTMNRKEFFKTSGRLLILGGITTSAGYLLVNNKVSASCSVSPTCQNCGKIANCETPAVKQERGEIKDETVSGKTP